jgi:hypothetical protein
MSAMPTATSLSTSARLLFPSSSAPSLAPPKPAPKPAHALPHVHAPVSEEQHSRPKHVTKEGCTRMWEVNKILGVRKARSKTRFQLQYLVRWKGYGHKDDTWEIAARLEKIAPEAVLDFKLDPKARRSNGYLGPKEPVFFLK